MSKEEMNDTKTSNSSAIDKIDKCRVVYTTDGPKIIIGPYKVKAGDMEITLTNDLAAYLLKIENTQDLQTEIDKIVKRISAEVEKKYKQGMIKTKNDE